ncbi:MAG: helix-turn-helix transcriptional regulator [Desulfurellaceae bacterium]|nr:helix-turn-helix transcriptional regulator [Desulfurellaceae bacterium]
MTDQGGVLRAQTPADRPRLARLVAAALPTSSSPPISGTTTLHRGALLPRFVVHVKPVGGGQQGYGARRAAVLVLVAEPGRPPCIDPGLVAATLGLTPGESQVAVWVAEGWTVREMAVATGRTDKAIRWHLQQIYHKQGISRQADLVRLVLSLATIA